MFTSLCNRFLSVAYLLLILSACATPPQTLKLKRQPLTDIQQTVVLEKAPFFPQQKYQCGPAALATMLVDRGIDISPDDLIDKVYIPERQGSLQLEMIATARSYDLLSYKLTPTLETILKEIDSGNLVLVFQNLGLRIIPKWHYAVAIGYDTDKSEIILRSGTLKKHSLSFSTFENTWGKANYWAYVFMPPGEIPVTAKPVQYIQSSHDLHNDHQALKAFRSGAIRWPQESIVLMAWGYAEFSAKNYGHAISAYQQEIRLRPNNANAWNNLSYVLASNNCKTQALAAVECANQLSPDDVNIQQSLLEIQQFPANNSAQCPQTLCPIR